MEHDGQRREVLFRRSALRLLQGDVDGATRTSPRSWPRAALSASFHGRYARCLLMQSLRAREASERRAALLDQALEQVGTPRSAARSRPGPLGCSRRRS